MKKQLLIILIFCFVSTTFAQKKDSDTTIASENRKEKKVNLTVMPFLSYNRNLKVMIGAIPMMMYKTNKQDTISPKSLSGLTAIYTTNGSYFITVFNKWHFKEDTWRANFFAVTGDYNSQFFIEDMNVSSFYNYETKLTYISAGIQREIMNSLYGGISYAYAHYDTSYEDDVQSETDSHTHSIELNLLYDTRNDVYYPTKGDKTKLRWNSFPGWLGNDVEANKIVTEYNKYIPVRKDKDVIAARFFGTFGLGNILFEQQVTIGGKDIRGYSEGKYRGDGLLDVQGEYRYNFNNKMGLVGFAGIATIYGSGTPDFDWKMYPGVGVGYRYRAFKAVKFNIGLDAAVGKDDWGVYFRIGEAF